jgi:tRNA-uridine aminocarboxypropyltransferase
VSRPVCYRCCKPQVTCVCARVPRVDNRTSVLVLQHPRERLHPIGTARFAQLGLCNTRIEVAWNAGRREEQAPAWLPEGTALLYPTPGARDLRALPVHERPRHLLVLDGTWHTARTLYRDKAWLAQLPHVRFTPLSPSNYRIRREPTRDHVSTIEAIVEALRVLEPETQGLDQLLAAFDAMIDDQLAHARQSRDPRRSHKRRPAAQRRIPEALVSGLARIIVVCVESSRAGRDAPRELVQVSAERLADSSLAQWHLLPRTGLPNVLVRSHMRLDEADFVGALDEAAFRARWAQFLAQREAPIVAAWNQSTFDLLAAAGAELPATLVLKSAYRGRRGAQHASLDDVVAAEALAPVPRALRGRAAQRIASAVAVARYLHALQAEPAARTSAAQAITTVLSR